MIQNQNLTVMKSKNQDCDLTRKKEPYFSTKSGIFGHFSADRNWKCHNNFEDEVEEIENDSEFDGYEEQESRL